MGQTEDEESSSGYDSFEGGLSSGVTSLSNPSYSGPSIHSIYAAALNNPDSKYTSEVQQCILTVSKDSFNFLKPSEGSKFQVSCLPLYNEELTGAGYQFFRVRKLRILSWAVRESR